MPVSAQKRADWFGYSRRIPSASSEPPTSSIATPAGTRAVTSTPDGRAAPTSRRADRTTAHAASIVAQAPAPIDTRAYGPAPADSVRAAVQDLEVERIGHNLGKIHDQETATFRLKYLTDDGGVAREETLSVPGRIFRKTSLLNEMIPGLIARLKALERQVDVEQQNYRLYLSRIEESRISEAMDNQKISNVTQVQPARTPLKPVSPKVGLNLVIGLFLGGFGSLGLAFFLEYIDDRLEKRDDAERVLNLPVLASIPELKA